MSLFKRDNSHPVICGILLSTSGSPKAFQADGGQLFFDTVISDADFERIYQTKGKVNFTERGSMTAAGMVYTQNLSISFPNAALRSEKLHQLQKTKFILVELNDGRQIVLGRNDFQQNALPLINVQSTEKQTQVEIKTSSIFASGFNQGSTEPETSSFYGLPSMISILLS